MSPLPPAIQPSLKPYTSLHLTHFPTGVFFTPTGHEIHPMWSGEGNLSYLVLNPKTKESFLIDPDLEILGSYLLTIEQFQIKLVAVIDTHTHAEHATTAPLLSDLLKVPYLMNHRAPSSKVTLPLQDQDERTLADLPLQFIHSPGHAPDLQVILTQGHVFTGDSLFISGSGRPDLPGGDAGQQFETLRRLSALPPDTLIHPGHDYNNRLNTTIAAACRENSRLQIPNRDAFIQINQAFYEEQEKPDDMAFYVAFNGR
jgi:sulfur dioxygenase